MFLCCREGARLTNLLSPGAARMVSCWVRKQPQDSESSSSRQQHLRLPSPSGGSVGVRIAYWSHELGKFKDASLPQSWSRPPMSLHRLSPGRMLGMNKMHHPHPWSGPGLQNFILLPAIYFLSVLSPNPSLFLPLHPCVFIWTSKCLYMKLCALSWSSIFHEAAPGFSTVTNAMPVQL